MPIATAEDADSVVDTGTSGFLLQTAAYDTLTAALESNAAFAQVFGASFFSSQGACADAAGPSGVHVAMSNTLNTPIEALERELPLRVTRYALRRGSGGAGVHRGGDGVVRELQALREMSFSLITERRRHAPPGAHGGEPGARGRNLLDGREHLR